MPSTVLQAIRGMNDILPGESTHWHALESTVRSVLTAYDYQEIRFPVVERTELFSRSIGEVTDIIEKEMYTFTDRNGESLSLRPEGTAGCVRACIEHGLLHHKTQRVWYTGPMFRYEKPQKGRYRQFHQIGAEAYGFLGPDIDAEMIALTARLWDRLGIRQLVRLELNSLGTIAARSAYREQLVAYFQTHYAALDADSQRRLHTNPLRILDSKNPSMQRIIANAPQLNDHLDTESLAHFEGLQLLLDMVGITYVVNPRLVRGLDYYSKTVFEWVTDHLGAQGTVCAGGRYDGLVAQLGGPQVAGVGFAMGVERLIALLEGLGALHTKPLDVYCILVGEAAQRHGFAIAEALRTALPTLGIRLNCGGGNFKSQFKRADQSGARFAVVLGEDEAQKGFITIKPLREAEGHQLHLPETQAIDYLRAALSEKG